MTTGRFLLSILLIVAVIPLPQIASAEIVVDIGGSPPQSPGSDPGCQQPNCVNLAGSYGSCSGGGAAITITNLSTGTARVEVVNDAGPNGIDYLAVKNTKITANCQASNFRIAFGFDHVSQPSPTLRYTYKASGNLVRSGATPPPGSYVKVKASYINSPPSPPSTTFNASGAIGAEKQSSSYLFSLSDITPNITSLTDPRGLEGEFTFTLPAQNDVLKMSTYYVQNTTSAGGGGDGDGGGGDHGESGLLTTLCPTTQATARAFGCASCVSEDGILAQDAKAELFAHAIWNNLSQDLAAGQGEYLTSLAALLDVPMDQHSTFFSLAEDHYIALMKTEAPTPDVFLATLKERMSADASVASGEIIRR